MDFVGPQGYYFATAPMGNGETYQGNTRPPTKTAAEQQHDNKCAADARQGIYRQLACGAALALGNLPGGGACSIISGVRSLDNLLTDNCGEGGNGIDMARFVQLTY
jgi:hypothetical protein